MKIVTADSYVKVVRDVRSVTVDDIHFLAAAAAAVGFHNLCSDSL